MAFIKHFSGSLAYYTDELMDSLNCLDYIFTTRLGGVSSGDLSSLNLGTGRNDNKENIFENYKRACTAVNLDFTKCVLAKQTHTTNIRIVTKSDSGKGLTVESDIKDTDGLITNEQGLPLVIFYADCVPILLFDPKQKVLACLHGGWRGTVNGIAEKGVHIMKNTFNCRDIYAAIGPSIGPCCFETGLETAEIFNKNGFGAFVEYNKDKAFIDLWSVNESILKSCGVKNISIAKICTVCHCDEFFSHRGCGASTGRMALIAAVR